MATKKKDLRNNDIFKSDKLPNGSYCTLTLLPEDGALRLLIKDDTISCICMTHEDYEALHKALGAELRRRKKSGDLLTHETGDSTVDVVKKPKKRAKPKATPKVGSLDIDAYKAEKMKEALQ
jgi:hypothetical protein